MIEIVKGGVRLHLFIQPNAAKNEVIGPHDKELKIKIAAPPVESRANEELVEFLSELLSVPKRNIHVVRGETGRHKTVEVQGLTWEAAQKLIAPPGPMADPAESTRTKAKTRK
ncbi:MAG: DUF167 domain-containing protein [Bdellovibrio sp.]